MAGEHGQESKFPDLYSYLKRSTSTTKMLANKSSNMVFSLLSTVLTGILVLVVSVFLYGTFYYAYMPLEMHNLPVNFQFDPCTKDTKLPCSYPSAQVQLVRNQKFLQGQTYSINLKLKVPDNPNNEDHGMFMSCLNVSSPKGIHIEKSCKSSIAEYKSPLLRNMETFALSPALLTGWSTQKQELVINFFSNFQTDPHAAAEVINIEIQSTKMQISEANLEIHAELKGLRHLMYRHPWISSFFGISTNIFILTAIILISWVRFLQPEEEAPKSSSSATESDVTHGQDHGENNEATNGSNVDNEVVEERVVDEDENNRGMIAQPKPSIIARLLKWVFLKSFWTVFKVSWRLLIIAILAVSAIACYKVTVGGMGTDNLELLAKTSMEEAITLFQFAYEKMYLLGEYVSKRFIK